MDRVSSTPIIFLPQHELSLRLTHDRTLQAVIQRRLGIIRYEGIDAAAFLQRLVALRPRERAGFLLASVFIEVTNVSGEEFTVVLRAQKRERRPSVDATQLGRFNVTLESVVSHAQAEEEHDDKAWSDGAYTLEQLAKFMKSPLWEMADARPKSQLLSVGATWLQKGRCDMPRALEYHLEALRLRERIGDPQLLAASHWNLGLVYEDLGKYTEAHHFFHLAVDFYKREGQDRAKIAEAYSHLATILEGLGDSEAAAASYEKSKTIYEGLPLETHPDSAHHYSRLAKSVLGLKRLEPALETFARALALEEQIHGRNHTHVGNIHFHTGHILFSLNRLEEALASYEKACQAYAGYYQEDHPDIADSRDGMGEVLLKLGRPQEALEHHIGALEIRQKLGVSMGATKCYQKVAACYDSLGNDAYAGKYRRLACCEVPPGMTTVEAFNASLEEAVKKGQLKGKADTWERGREAATELAYLQTCPFWKEANSALKSRLLLIAGSYLWECERKQERALCLAETIIEIGDGLKDLKHYEEARHVFHDALYLKRAIKGRDHAEVAALYSDIGDCLEELQLYLEAEDSFQKALQIYRAIYGEHHPEVAGAYYNVGFLLQQQEKHAEAENSFCQAIRSWKADQEELPAEAAECFFALGVSLQSLKRHRESTDAFLQALKLWKQGGKTSHAGEAEAYCWIGANFQKSNDHRQAAAAFLDAVNVWSRMKKMRHLAIAKCYFNAAISFQEMGKYTPAIENFRKAIEIREALRSEADPEVAKSYFNIGVNSAHAGEYEEAKEAFLKGVKLEIQIQGGEFHPSVVQYYEQIIQALEMLRQEDEVQVYRDKIAQIGSVLAKPLKDKQS